VDFAPRDGDSIGIRLVTHVHHTDAAIFIEMGKFV
jgi:hypothetical protein